MTRKLDWQVITLNHSDFPENDMSIINAIKDGIMIRSADQARYVLKRFQAIYEQEFLRGNFQLTRKSLT
ncbi:hypothetical protein DFP94_101108 [Fontibacillus phaseoli]|uniref:Uncharacterized protein n=1 Tax=Fontibacillus phaseoli TaxID=1416533 RepID=A0A369BPG6_9BACL|nr:hypothetical protein [Fontibacillus phaseoli]RCX22528.1 hypothetical protein DFP94_101108 [Fontibacillus phaseoli]